MKIATLVAFEKIWSENKNPTRLGSGKVISIFNVNLFLRPVRSFPTNLLPMLASHFRKSKGRVVITGGAAKLVNWP